jgi:hypothetical protein
MFRKSDNRSSASDSMRTTVTAASYLARLLAFLP